MANAAQNAYTGLTISRNDKINPNRKPNTIQVMKFDNFNGNITFSPIKNDTRVFPCKNPLSFI